MTEKLHSFPEGHLPDFYRNGFCRIQGRKAIKSVFLNFSGSKFCEFKNRIKLVFIRCLIAIDTDFDALRLRRMIHVYTSGGKEAFLES